MRTRPDFADSRRKEAKERQERYDALSLGERVDKANRRPGNSIRELARLSIQMHEPKEKGEENG